MEPEQEPPLSPMDPEQQPQEGEKEEGLAPKAKATVECLPLDWTQMGPPTTAVPPAERILYPSDVLDYTPETTAEELIIIGTHGFKITHMGKDLYKTCGYTTMKTLILRSHLIRKMEGLGGFEQLETLELYDNQIPKIENLTNLIEDDEKTHGQGDEKEEHGDDEKPTSSDATTSPNKVAASITPAGIPGNTIRILDLSYNVIRDMEPVMYCPNLVELCK